MAEEQQEVQKTKEAEEPEKFVMIKNLINDIPKTTLIKYFNIWKYQKPKDEVEEIIQSKKKLLIRKRTINIHKKKKEKNIEQTMSKQDNIVKVDNSAQRQNLTTVEVKTERVVVIKNLVDYIPQDILFKYFNMWRYQKPMDEISEVIEKKKMTILRKRKINIRKTKEEQKEKIDKIKMEKEDNQTIKEKLKKNINSLEELSTNLQRTINELKNIYETIDENKQKLKLKIIKVFDTIRKAVNKREKEILLQIDKKCEDLFFGEDLIKESEKLPEKVKVSLERKNIPENEWNDKKQLVVEYLKAERNIREIQNLKKCTELKDLEITFDPKEEEIEQVLEPIKNFGIIYYNNQRIN